MKKPNLSDVYYLSKLLQNRPPYENNVELTNCDIKESIEILENKYRAEKISTEKFKIEFHKNK